MALRGIKVLEFEGLAPVPYCGMILSDFGADVIRIDRPNSQFGFAKNYCGRGKRSLSLNLKDKESQEIIFKLIEKSDVLIDPYRPGVLEKLGFGPETALKLNSRLIYARLSGFGQTGPLADKGGHDINYLALSGLLSMIGRKHEKPLAPLNIIGDFAGGSLLCALGILLALFERHKTDQGQVIDAAIVDGISYLATFIYNANKGTLWSKPRGENVLDSGSPFYDVYETKDKKYMAVGSIEPLFFNNLLKGLEIDPNKFNQFDTDNWENMRNSLKNRFLTKTQDEWISIFNELDACVTPVLTLDQFKKHPNTKARKLWNDALDEPSPVPILSGYPYTNNLSKPAPQDGQHSIEILLEFGFDKTDIKQWLDSKVIYDHKKSSL